eukprot:gene6500-13125_t
MALHRFCVESVRTGAVLRRLTWSLSVLGFNIMSFDGIRSLIMASKGKGQSVPALRVDRTHIGDDQSTYEESETGWDGPLGRLEPPMLLTLATLRSLSKNGAILVHLCDRANEVSFSSQMMRFMCCMRLDDAPVDLRRGSSSILLFLSFPDPASGLCSDYFDAVNWVHAVVLMSPRQGRGEMAVLIGTDLLGAAVTAPFVTDSVLFLSLTPSTALRLSPLADLSDSEEGSASNEEPDPKRARCLDSPTGDTTSQVVSATKATSGCLKYSDLDLNLHECSVKSEGVARVEKVQLLLRVLHDDPALRKELFRDLLFKLPCFVSSVCERGLATDVSPVGDYDLILEMTVSRSASKMEAAILGEWEPYHWGHMSVLDFASTTRSTTSTMWEIDSITTAVCCQALSNGLSGLQRFWATFWHVDFLHCLTPLRIALEDSRLAHFRYSHNVFLRTRVEQLICDFCTDVRKRETSVRFKLSPSSRQGCLALLNRYIDDFINGPAANDTAVRRWERAPHQRFFATEWIVVASYFGSTGSSTPTKKAAVPSAKTPASTATPKEYCGFHIAHLLTFSSGPRAVDCNMGRSCPKPHCALKFISKAEAVAAVENINFRNKDALLVLIKKQLPQDDCASASLSITVNATNAPAEGRQLRSNLPPPSFFDEARLEARVPVEVWQLSSGDGVLEDITCCPKDIDSARLLRIASSLIPFAGLGAFPRRELPVGTWLGTFRGSRSLAATNKYYQMEWDGCVWTLWSTENGCIRAYTSTTMEMLQDTESDRMSTDVIPDSDSVHGRRYSSTAGLDCLETPEGGKLEDGWSLEPQCLSCVVVVAQSDSDSVHGRQYLSTVGPDCHDAPGGEEFAEPQSLLVGRGPSVRGAVPGGETNVTCVPRRRRRRSGAKTTVGGAESCLSSTEEDPQIGTMGTSGFDEMRMSAAVRPLSLDPAYQTDMKRLRFHHPDYLCDMGPKAWSQAEEEGSELAEEDVLMKGWTVDDEEVIEEMYDNAFQGRWILTNGPRPVEAVDPSDDFKEMARITNKAIVSYATSMERLISTAEIESVVREAYDHNALVKTSADASTWGANYNIPEELIVEDRELLMRMMTVRAIAEHKLYVGSRNRLCPERVAHFVSRDNPDYDRILQLATSGMPILTSPSFIPNMGNPCPPVLSPATMLVLSAVQKMMIEGILVPLEVMRASGEQFHVSRHGWAPKHGKSDLEFNLVIVESMVESLLGKGSIAADKTSSGRRLIDLDHREVYVSRRCLLSAVSTIIGHSSLVFVMLCLIQKITIVKAVHISGVDNWRTDTLSRGVGWKDIVKRDDRFLDMVDILEGKSADPILRVCDPHKKEKCVDSEQRANYATREARCVKAVLSRSVVTVTKKRIEAGFKRWSEFLNVHVGERTDPYMRGLSDKAKCYRILMFMDMLYESGLRKRNISILVSQVRSAFSLEGRECSVFESELIKTGREGGRLTTEEGTKSQTTEALRLFSSKSTRKATACVRKEAA